MAHCCGSSASAMQPLWGADLQRLHGWGDELSLTLGYGGCRPQGALALLDGLLELLEAGFADSDAPLLPADG